MRAFGFRTARPGSPLPARNKGYKDAKSDAVLTNKKHGPFDVKNIEGVGARVLTSDVHSP